MTEQDDNQIPASGDETMELAAESDQTVAQDSVGGQETPARRVPGWVLPVAVGGAGLVLAIATGVGGFLVGVQASDGFDRAWTQEHSEEDAWMEDEFRGPGKGRGDGMGRGDGRGHSHDGERGGPRGGGFGQHGAEPGEGLPG